MTKAHRGHSVSANSTQNMGVKAVRAPRVPVRSVPCPICGVPVDEFCISGTGALQPGNVHESRRRLALRKMREETE